MDGTCMRSAWPPPHNIRTLSGACVSGVPVVRKGEQLEQGSARGEVLLDQVMGQGVANDLGMAVEVHLLHQPELVSTDGLVADA